LRGRFEAGANGAPARSSKKNLQRIQKKSARELEPFHHWALFKAFFPPTSKRVLPLRGFSLTSRGRAPKHKKHYLGPAHGAGGQSLSLGLCGRFQLGGANRRVSLQTRVQAGDTTGVFRVWGKVINKKKKFRLPAEHLNSRTPPQNISSVGEVGPKDRPPFLLFPPLGPTGARSSFPLATPPG